MPIDFQPIQQNSQAPVSKIDFQPLTEEAAASATPTSLGSKAVAATGAAVQGTLKGIGSTLAAGPNIIQAGVEKGLNLLAENGIVPDSLAKRYASGRQVINKAEADFGKKILEFQGKASETERKENPKIAKYSKLAGEMVGSSLAAGGVVGNLGKGMAPVTAGIINQGSQGVLMGGAVNPEEPLKGAAIGGAVGGVLGGIVGHFDKSAEIINDRLQHVKAMGYKPSSEQGLKTIKESLDSGGKDLATEQIQAQTKKVIQSKLDDIAPSVEFANEAPVEMVTRMAKSNFGKVRAERDALYAPLNEATSLAETPLLNQTIASLKSKTAQKMIPEPLAQNASLSDLMTYRRQVSAAINQTEKVLKKGSTKINFQTLDDLHAVKSAITKDLEVAAEKAGLGGQLAKADAFHMNSYKPFEVYNKSGKLVSDVETTRAWDKMSKVLKSKFPNTTAMGEIAKTLGPEGKQVFGYAYIQNAVNKAMDVDGKILINTLSKDLNKIANSGIDKKIFTPQVQEAFEGLRLLAESGGKILKMTGNETSKQGAIMSFINKLSHSSAGITLLRGLGSKTTDAAKLKNLAGQVLINATQKEAANLTQEDN